MNKRIFSFYLITALAIYMSTANAATEKWECASIQVPDGYNDRLPDGKLLPITFTYNRDTKIAKVSLSGNKEITGFTNIGTINDSLTSISGTLEKNSSIKYLIAYKPLYSVWEITFSKYEGQNFFSTSPISLSCIKSEITDEPKILRLDIEEGSGLEPTVTTPLNKDSTQKSCLAKCCGLLCRSGNDSSQ
ncbi:MAG: hypothetical protein K0R14_1225 [Burkholderiales bacterium]|jgi:hypothetical protein|nr:hypothetical protein [Burkholderiales bacterium]